MPGKIEFIPYGEEWSPEVSEIHPVEEWHGLRKPRTPKQTLRAGATAIDVICGKSDTSLLCLHTDSDGIQHNEVVNVSNSPLIIHRASPIKDNRRGTVRISYLPPLENDHETAEASNPHPSLSAEEAVTHEVSPANSIDVQTVTAAVMAVASHEAANNPTEIIN